MTTLQMQTTSQFEASATEDLMELTSDMDRRFAADEDIDIDLDLTADNHQDQEDEYMGEDVNVFTDPAPIREQDIHTSNDDEMADDYVEGSTAERSSVHDEDLQDATSTAPDLDEDTIIETLAEKVPDETQGLSENQEEIPPSVDHDLDYPEQPSTSEVDSGGIFRMLPDGQTDPMPPSHDSSGLATRETPQELSQELSKEQEDETSKTDEFSNQEASQVHPQEPLREPEEEVSRYEDARLEYSVDEFSGEASRAPESISKQSRQLDVAEATSKEEVIASANVEEEAHLEEASTAPGQSSSENLASLFPVVVIYQDSEISLFPPVDQDEEHSATYFLQDDRVAGEPIRNLLGAFRSILGESISKQDELVISIDDLGLHFSEVSLSYAYRSKFATDFLQFTTESSDVTLLQLIDVYINLQHNDGLENPPPVYMNLITKTAFSHRFHFLRNAVIEGKGLSQVRSSEIYYDDQQAGADGAQGRRFGDDLEHINVARNNDTELPINKKGMETTNPHDNGGSQIELLPLADPSQTEDTATRASVPQSNIGDLSKETDFAETQSETQIVGKIINHSDDEITEAVKSNEEASTQPLLPLAGQTQHQPTEESTLEDEDSIEYEDEGLAPGISSGSSTLQGDSLDTNTDRDQADTEGQNPSAHGKELDAFSNIPDSTAVAEDVQKEHITVSAGREDQAHYVGEDELEYPSYPGEGEEVGEHDSSHEYKEQWNDEAEGAQSENEPRDDQPRPIDTARDDGDEMPFYQRNSSEEADETQEQGTQNLPEENPEDGATSNIDTEDRLTYHSNKNEDQGLNDPNQEKRIDIDDAGKYEGLADDNTGLVYPNDNHVNSSSGTKPESTDPEYNIERSGVEDDEISYEDEDDEGITQEPSNAEHNVAPSPGSLKRVWSLQEDDDPQEEDLQGKQPPFYNTRGMNAS